MRVTNFLFLVMLMAGYMLFTSSSCETCDALALADLTVDTFEGELFDIGPDGDLIYSFTSKVLNILAIANGCTEAESNATAGPNGFLEQVVFSQNGTFNDAVIVHEMVVEINSLAPAEKAIVEDEVRIAVNGSYRFYSTVDVRDDVEERDEENNAGNVTIKSIFREFIVSGALENPLRDEQGNLIYVTRKNAPKVSYEF